jgi:serine/threonine-protein kinase
MPPVDDPRVKSRPSDEEIAVIKRWIESGAPAWVIESERQFVSEEEALKKIFSHLAQSIDPADSKHFRYFSLVHLHNNPLVQDEDLRYYRAAFVKLINSLSRSAEFVDPQLIDAPPENPTDGLIFCVDLRKLRWKLEEYRKVIKEYPYGLTFNAPTLRNLQTRIIDNTGKPPFDNEGLPYVRVDWFIATASRPPHYHNLLEVPATAAELEQSLRVNIKADFDNNQLRRAGFAGSGVSRHNRLVDRHVGSTAYYYKSYDFGKSSGKSVLFRFPLGPRLENGSFNDFAFEHDGGEIIWRLDNGMQGYMLVDKDGNRINEGPISIVRDLNEHANTPIITNGVSCFGCHRHGIMDLRDTVRKTSEVLADVAREKIEKLYAPEDEMKDLVARDRKQFLDAMDRMIGKYLRGDPRAKEPSIETFPEPVSEAVRRYGKDLRLADVAAELGLERAADLGARLNDPRLLDLGLGPLGVDGAVPRALWDSREEAGVSVFQRAIVVLGLGRSKNF